jgi:hypothetical protein
MSIQAAAVELERARALSRARRRERERARSEVSDLEAAVDAVERHSLESIEGIPAQVRALVGRLATRLSVSAPPSVMRARTLTRLHDALLDWQGRLLDYTTPQRCAFGDRYD